MTAKNNKLSFFPYLHTCVLAGVVILLSAVNGNCQSTDPPILVLLKKA
jgi:hypothetical protein